MTNVYVPVYDGKRKVVKLDGDLLVTMGIEGKHAVYYKPGVGTYGNFWNADAIFTTEDAAWRYWSGYSVAPEERFKVTKALQRGKVVELDA